MSSLYIWAYLTNCFSVTDGICTDFSKFNLLNSIFSGCPLAQGYFWTQSMISTDYFVNTISRDLSRRIRKNVTDGMEETHLFEIFTCTLNPSKSKKDVDLKFSVKHIESFFNDLSSKFYPLKLKKKSCEALKIFTFRYGRNRYGRKKFHLFGSLSITVFLNIH